VSENIPHAMQVLVVEDFEPYRQFVKSSLAKMDGLQIAVSEAIDGLQAVDQARELKPSLILLDIGLPKLSGIEAAKQILAALPESKIIFLTQETSHDVMREALNVGAYGYVVKSRAATDLVPAVQAALDGKRFISAGLATHDL
jgi:DNA-binding NarL/FixJ family response regulator